MKNASAQMQLDKSFELTGTFPDNQIIGAGALGIGTLSPAHKIDVVGGDINVSSGSGFRISGAAPVGQFLRGDGTRFVSSAIAPGDIPSGIGSYIQNQIGADQSAGFRISGNGLFSSGSVGIGTVTPASKLDVSDGRLTLSGSTGNAHGILFDRGVAISPSATQGSIFQEWNGIGGSSESLTFRADNYKFQNHDGADEIFFRNGFIGIGTSNPGAPLSVAQESSYTFPNPGFNAKGAINIRATTSNRQTGITFSQAGVDDAQAGIYVHQDGGAGTHMHLATTNSYAVGPQVRMTLLNTGNIGIGTTSPASKLDVSDGSILLSGSAANQHGILFERGSAVAPSASQASIFQQLNGINGNAESLTFRSDNYKFQNYDGTEEIYFRDGNIGVRAANPSYHLQVGDQIAGNNVDYSLGVIRHGTAASPGTYTANSPSLKIDDLSNDGPAANESAGMLYILAGRIGDADVNAGNANMLSIQNDNGHALVVKANRRVGINTNVPGTGVPLTISHEGIYNFPQPGTQAKGAINIRMTNSSRQSGITFSSASADDAQAGIYVHQDNSAGTHMYFATTGSYASGPQTWMTLRNNGRLGIGTINPLGTTHIRSASLSSFLGGGYGHMALDATYNAGYFMPIDFLSSPDAAPAVRIAAQMNSFGSCLVTGTSSNYASGITNYGMVLDHVGNMAVGYAPTAYSYRLDVNGHTRTIGFTNLSDARFKKNLEPLGNSLAKLTQLQGVSYHWRKEEFPDINFDDRKQIGFLAQDLEKVLPEAVSEDNKGYKSVNYIMLIPMLVEGMKEQQTRIENQQSQIDKLIEQNKRLMERLEDK